MRTTYTQVRRFFNWIYPLFLVFLGLSRLKGTLPFAECNAEKTLLNTVGGIYDMESEHWDNISHEAKDLLSKLLEVDPHERIDLKEAVNHEWFTCIFTKARSSNSQSDTNETQQKCSLD